MLSVRTLLTVHDWEKKFIEQKNKTILATNFYLEKKKSDTYNGWTIQSFEVFQMVNNKQSVVVIVISHRIAVHVQYHETSQTLQIMRENKPV